MTELFWKDEMHWAWGVGFMVLFIAVGAFALWRLFGPWFDKYSVQDEVEQTPFAGDEFWKREELEMEDSENM